MTDTEALIALNMMNGIGPARINALLSVASSPAAIFDMTEADLAQVKNLSKEQRIGIRNWQTNIDLSAEMRMVERGNVKVLTVLSPDYPEILKSLPDAPVCLYVRGTIPASVSERSIAIVGTRNVSNYGADMTRRLAEEASYAGWNVVSGLAVGVDTIAHRATVNAGGKTIAVLGGGLSRLHPRENLQLARDIIETGGAVITEFPMLFSPTRHSFPMRNRIISGLSQGTIVTEAGINSGSLITASFALEQQRRVFAVPQNVNNLSPSGCNELIRKGAVLIENFGHVLDEFDFLPGLGNTMNLSEDAATHSGTDQESQNAGGGFVDFQTDTEKNIVAALTKGDLNLDALSAKTGIPPQDLTAALISLELKMSVEKKMDGTFHKVH